MSDPTNLKSWKHKRVVLVHDMRTRGGQVFRAGEILRVQEARSDGSFTLKRDPAAINVERSHFVYTPESEEVSR